VNEMGSMGSLDPFDNDFVRPPCHRCGKTSEGWGLLPWWLEDELREAWGFPDDAYLREATVQSPLCGSCSTFESQEDERIFWFELLGLKDPRGGAPVLPLPGE
jgi:hypothetical protein